MQIFEKNLNFFQRLRWKKAYYVFLTYGWETGLITWMQDSVNPDNYLFVKSGRENLSYNFERRERYPKEEKITIFLKKAEDGERLVQAVSDAIRRDKEIKQESNTKSEPTLPTTNTEEKADDIDLSKRAIEL